MPDSVTDPLFTAPTLPMTGRLVAIDPGAAIDTTKPRYEVVDALGAGGMGEVNLCADRRIGREVAMKVMRGEVAAQPELRARFLREAIVQGQLEHPSVVPVYDMGVGEGGTPYFTMKRVRGTTLSAILERLRAADPEAERVYSRHKLLTSFVSVCQAMHFAHARGVVHRDVKPDNVMLGDFGEVYVLDWGIARIGLPPEAEAAPGVTASASVAPTRTEHGNMLGTPGYMAPEQIVGDRDVDARADIFALGAILFEVLTLQPLHSGKSADELREDTLAGCDARPSVRAPARDVAPELEEVCMRATARQRDDRFASAREMHEAVERFLEGDRDVERRRRLSVEHADRAKAAASLALAGTGGALPARAEAVRELGRALVLDPGNTAAADRLLELLTTEPPDMPLEVEDKLARDNAAVLRVRAFWGALGFSSAFVFLPLLYVAGIKNYALLGAATALWTPAVIGYVLLFRRPTPDGTTPLLMQILIGLAMVAAGVFVGSLILVPPVVVVTVYGMALGTKKRRWSPAIIGCLAMIVPYVLERMGLVPPAYGFRDGAMLVLPRSVELTPFSCVVLLAMNSFAAIFAALLGHGFRDVLAQAQRSVHLREWQLRQLLPAAQQASAASSR